MIPLQLPDVDWINNMLTRFEPSGRPDTFWRYANFNYRLMQLVVETLTHLPYTHVVEELVFKPAGIQNSYAIERGTWDTRDVKAPVFYSNNFPMSDMYSWPAHSHWFPAGGWLMSAVDQLKYLVGHAGFQSE